MCKIEINDFPANYISYKPTVRFGDKGYLVEKFSPYYEIIVSLSEIYKCPFCGQVIQLDHKCNCDEYKKAFEKTLENYGCIPSKCTFDLRTSMQKSLTFYRTVDEIKSRLLKRQEIKAFDVDFWDFSDMYPVCGEKGFRFANPSYEDGVLKFYWKNLKTKSVFLCSLDGLEVETHRSLSLQEVIRNDKNPLYEKIAEFADWNDFCRVLKKS